MHGGEVERQGAAAPRRESDEMLSLSTYVSHQSRGMPVQVSIDGAAKPHFEAGRALYQKRMGQMNLACANCHDANWGRHRIFGGHLGVFPELWFFYPTAGQSECDKYAFFNYAEGWWGWGRLSRSMLR